MLFMSPSASPEVLGHVARQHRRFQGLRDIGLGGGDMVLAGTLITVFALTASMHCTR
jgi:hypothetical protein